MSQGHGVGTGSRAHALEQYRIGPHGKPQIVPSVRSRLIRLRSHQLVVHELHQVLTQHALVAHQEALAAHAAGRRVERRTGAKRGCKNNSF